MNCRALTPDLHEATEYDVSMDQNAEALPLPQGSTRQIDGVDRAIIAAVTHDARISLTDLAEQINVSRSTVHTRLQRLRDERIITGFTATVDPIAVGLGVAALVFIDIEQHDWRSLRTDLAAIPGVEYLAMCAGRFDLMLIARAETIPALRDVLLEQIQRMPGVRSTESVIILDEVRSTGRRAPVESLEVPR